MNPLSRRQLFLTAGAGLLGAAACTHPRTKGSVPMSTDQNDARFDAVDARIERDLADGHYPGAILVVSVDGRVVHERHWGTYANEPRASNPVTPQTRVMLYSFSKLVSSTVVMSVAGEGKLDLDAPLRDVLPGFEGHGKERITLRHALTHSAGIPSHGDADSVMRLERDDWSGYFKHLCTLEPEWPAGSRTHYHGVTGLFLAGLAATRVTGKDFETLCRERLLDPIGATSLSFAPPEDREALAITHLPKQHPASIDENPYRAWRWHPAGAMMGRPADMLRVLQVHLSGGAWQGRQLLQPATIAEMHRVQYQAERDAARARGEAPVHETWGLGILMRADAPGGWFGLGEGLSPRAFGHAGISTIVGNADPDRRLAYAFAATGEGPGQEETTATRNDIANLLAEVVPAGA